MATTDDARARARRIVEETLAGAGVVTSPDGGDRGSGRAAQVTDLLEDPPESGPPAPHTAPSGEVASSANGDGDRTEAADVARRIVAEVMAEERARAEALEAAAAEAAAARAAALARAAEEADAAAEAAADQAAAAAADGIPVPDPMPAPDPLPTPEPFPEPSEPRPPPPGPMPPDPGPDPVPPEPDPDPLPPDPYPPEPEPEPVGDDGGGPSVAAAVPVASVDLFPTVTQPTDIADGAPAAATRELPADPEAPSGPPPLPVAVVSGWWRRRRTMRQRQRAMAEWAPEAAPGSRRTWRWLVVTIVMVVAVALLFPLAVDAVRQLVAL